MITAADQKNQLGHVQLQKYTYDSLPNFTSCKLTVADISSTNTQPARPLGLLNAFRR